MIFHNATNIAPSGPTVLEFGVGDIIINKITPGEGADYPFGVSFTNTDNPTPPGTDRPDFDGSGIADFRPQAIMTFTSAESFDVVISRLQLAKQAFMNATPAA